MRLNTFLAHAGLTSRRGAAAYLLDHDVRINGRIAREPGVAVDEEQDRVTVGGRQIKLEQTHRYFLLNKPKGVVTTVKDPEGRPTVIDCLPTIRERVYPVGRLDRDTTGVLLLTNDGDLAFRLMHPRFKVVKVYEARVDGRFSDEASEKLRAGVRLFDGSLGKAEVTIVARNDRGSVLKLRLIEGKKHEVKQLCEVVGYPVRHLKRIRFADLEVYGMPQGAWRELTKLEISRLQAATAPAVGAPRPRITKTGPTTSSIGKHTPAKYSTVLKRRNPSKRPLPVTKRAPAFHPDRKTATKRSRRTP